MANANIASQPPKAIQKAKMKFKRFLPIFIILALMAIAYFTGVTRYLTFESLKAKHDQLSAFVELHPTLTPFLFICVYIVATALSLPGGLFLSLIGGFLFEVPWSTLYVVIGATIGAALLFLSARTALGNALQKRAGPILKKMEAGFHENAASYLLFLRFVPVFPFWIVNLAPAFFNVSLWTYIWTTFVGIIPGAFVFTQAGSGLSAIFASNAGFSLSNIFNLKVKIALIALALFALLPIAIKKIRKKKDAGKTP